MGAKPFSRSLNLLSCIDIDVGYSRDFFLYAPTHQEEVLSDLLLRNKMVADDVNTYKRSYTECQLRKQKKSCTSDLI